MATQRFLHQLMTLPTVQNAQLSPDGKWVAFVWYRVHENMDVFLVPADGSRPPVALTHTPEATWLVSWTSDSTAVLVSEDHNRDERARLFRVDIDRPGEMLPLTEDRPPFFIRGGNLSPDGQALFYGANYDFEQGQESDATWVYRHDLQTGQRTAIARPEKPAYVMPQLNRQGSHVLYNRKDRHPAGWQWWLVDVEGGADREILNLGDEAHAYAEWLPDGANILVISDMKGAGRQEYQSVGLYHWPSGKLRWLVDDPQRSIENVSVSPDGLVIIDEMRLAGHRPSFIDPAVGVETAFPNLPGNLLPVGRAADGAWIGLYYSSVSPIELVRFTLDARSPQDLHSLTRAWERTDLLPEQLVQAEDFGWESVDGAEIHGWLYRAEPNPRRAILFIHGGPTHHSEDRLNPQVQYLVSRGFNVLDVNYRGSTGFGVNFRESIKVDGWGGREQADITTGAEALVRAGLAEPGRVGVTGTSYGGYSSWCQITGITGGTDYQVIGASAPVCGMTDLVMDYETMRPDLRPYSEEMIGGSPSQVPEKYRERSPIHHVESIRGKLMIIQGGLDPNVAPPQVHAVVKRLEACGIWHELLVFEDEGHGIVKPANQERLYPALADFFEKAL